MKEIINYNYNFDIIECRNFENYTVFDYNGDIFYFVFFNRTEAELNDLIKIIFELKNKNIKVHDIILNREKKALTKVGNVNYILLKLNNKFDEKINFTSVCELSEKLKLNNNSSKLYRNNWGDLWSKKIDYFEYQIKEIGKDKQVVLDSFSYYVGLAENAISYVNKVNKTIKNEDFNNITLSHRRIYYPNISLNYYNPLSFIFDLNIRDVAEYIKAEFFNNGDSFFDLKTFLKSRRLSIYSYHMLFARLLYPSYYFDIYESIMNNNDDDKKMIKIISKVHDYEVFLKKSYDEINKYCAIESVDWIIKNN